MGLVKNLCSSARMPFQTTSSFSHFSMLNANLLIRSPADECGGWDMSFQYNFMISLIKNNRSAGRSYGGPFCQFWRGIDGLSILNGNWSNPLYHIILKSPLRQHCQRAFYTYQGRLWDVCRPVLLNQASASALHRI